MDKMRATKTRSRSSVPGEAQDRSVGAAGAVQAKLRGASSYDDGARTLAPRMSEPSGGATGGHVQRSPALQLSEREDSTSSVPNLHPLDAYKKCEGSVVRYWEYLVYHIYNDTFDVGGPQRVSALRQIAEDDRGFIQELAEHVDGDPEVELPESTGLFANARDYVATKAGLSWKQRLQRHKSRLRAELKKLAG